MSLRRLRQLVDRAERQAESRSVGEMLEDSGHLEIDGIWYGPETYLPPVKGEVMSIAREMHEVDNRGEVEKFTGLASELAAIKRDAMRSFTPPNRRLPSSGTKRR